MQIVTIFKYPVKRYFRNLYSFFGKSYFQVNFVPILVRKKRDWITNYFMQESAYAVMFEEMTDIPVSQLVTIIAVESDEPQVFVEKRDDHINDFLKLRDQWESETKTGAYA